MRAGRCPFEGELADEDWPGMVHRCALETGHPGPHRSSVTTDPAAVAASVCVLCGEPWLPSHKNRCECGGFCTWGPAKGTDPSSWDVTAEGWRPKPVPRESK